MQKERRSVATYLENQAVIERDHLQLVEKVSNARTLLNFSNRIRNSRVAVVSLLAGLGTLVAIDVFAGDEIPEPLQLAMDTSQVLVSGALIGSAVRPASRIADGVLSVHDEILMRNSFNGIKVKGPEIIIGENDVIEPDSDLEQIQNIRAELAGFGRDLSEKYIPKRNIGDPTGNEKIDTLRNAIAVKLSHEKELPIMVAGMVEAYIERGQVSSERRQDPRLGALDELVDNLTTETDRKMGEKRKHSEYLDGIVMLFMESQVISERMKQGRVAIQKRAGVITTDFIAGVGSMTALVLGASAAVSPDYKGLAYFADDVASLIGIGLAPAFKRLLSTETAFEIRANIGARASLMKEKFISRFDSSKKD